MYILRAAKEVVATALDVILPSYLSRFILPTVDHYAPHSPDVGFEGWYTRIQDESLSMAVIFCSLGSGTVGPKKHYVHFSVSPTANTSLDLPREIHRFPDQIVPTVTSMSCFTLEAPGIGTFACTPELQTYILEIPEPATNSLLLVTIHITSRTPLDNTDIYRTPHGKLARMETTLPLHWHVFSTCSRAAYDIRRRVLGQSDQVLLQGIGRAHLEKNWGNSFPQGWTWCGFFISKKRQLADADLLVHGVHPGPRLLPCSNHRIQLVWF